ncbi:MAG: endolytic transglycosylase MltG [Desulfobacter sp.]|nr:MAG: endolytic transglycosylase MltG [Desulfobacter sp.]
MTDRQKKKKKTGWGKPLLLFSAILVLGGCIAAGTGLLWMKSFITTPADPKGKPVAFTVSRGQTMAAIAQNLKHRGLVSDPLRFKLYARYKKAATLIKTGEYQLSPALSPDKILEALVSGKVKLYRITVPEGLNMEEIAALAQEKGFCTADQFLTLCKDKAFIRKLGLSGITLEGYLYPDTYLFPKNTSCRSLIEKMAATFKQTFSKAWEERAEELGFTIHEIVTLASIIEKETGDAGERPLIASVFHNRLKKNMRLESDPTVIYGVDDYHGRIRYRHLRRLTPYNTYQIKGLPLGPIANPGAKALEAALYPTQSDYLFFVSKNDTTHQFSTNLRDHNRAVKKYQLNR